ncbi:MAG: TolC family protein [Elusimicrobiota bacterium]|nr:TolC family protein [Elusimicrobiota bacterium]
MGIIPLLLIHLATPAAALDLAAAAEAAVARSPHAAEAKARRTQAQAAGREVFWTRWPRLSARGSAMRSDDPLFAFGELMMQRRVTAPDFDPGTLNRPGYRTGVHGSLELGVPLFTGFELRRAGKLAGLAADEAEVMGGAAAQAVRLRTTDAYLRDLKAGALLSELDARLATARAAVDSAERLRKQGLVLGSDHQAALAVLSGLKAWRARAAAEREAHRAELGVLLGGLSPDTTGTLRDWAPPVEDDAALVAAALASRPELRAAGLRTRAAGVKRDGASQSILPTVDAFAAVNNSADGFHSGAASRLVGVRASILFGDPAYASRRARAAADENAAAAARAGAEDAARGEVLARAAGLRGLAAALPEVSEALARARASLEQVRPLYREGRQSVLEVLRAEEAVARLEEARLETVYRQRAEWASLRAAQGLYDADAAAALGRSLEATQ